MSLFPTASLLGLGLLFGLKHALEADHLAAVSTIVSEQQTWLGSLRVGLFWGIGHTMALFSATIAVMVFRVEIPPSLALGVELCVGLMLVWLGATALWKLARGARIHLHPHQHGGRVHLHPHLHDAPDSLAHEHHVPHSRRPLLVGMMHGLAGSAALMLLVLSTSQSAVTALALVAAFGIGSIGGMVAMSALVGLPARWTAVRYSQAHLVLRTAAGLFSIGLGLSMVYEIGITGGFI